MQMSDLQKYGIPSSVLDAWKSRLGAALLPVQRRAVRKGLLDGHDGEQACNLIISAPTSSGKSFCAEMAVIKALTSRQRCVLLFPLKSLAEQVYRVLSTTYGSLGIDCLIATGDYPQNDRAFAEGRYQVAVAVYEKFDLLLTADLDALKGIGLVIVDELQMVAEKGRGAVLERILTRIAASGYKTRLLALSAVLGEADIQRLCDWLGATAVEESGRPVELLRGVAAAGTLSYRAYNSGQDGSEPFADFEVAGEDSISAFVGQLKKESGSTLVFVKSRLDTVNLALKLAASVNWPSASKALAKLCGEEPSFLVRSLSQAMGRGVAFHNADLTSAQRFVIEEAFIDKSIKVIISTTTLAMGVNLPADTVYLETVKYASGSYGGRPSLVPISRAEFDNMTGRAGRLGLGDGCPGRAIVVAGSEFDREVLWQQYIAPASTEELTSAFDSLPAEDWLLSMITSGLVAEESDIDRVFARSFKAVCGGSDSHRLSTALEVLVDSNLVLREPSGSLRPSAAGRAAALTGLTVGEAVHFRTKLDSGYPQRSFGWMALALSSSGWDLPPGLLSRAELFQHAPVRLLHQHFDDLLDDARYLLPDSFRREPLSHRQAASLKALLVLEDWRRLTPVQSLEERYQIHLGQIMSLGETAAHLLNGLSGLITATDRENPAIALLRETSFSVRYGLPSGLMSLYDHLGDILNRSDFLTFHRAGLDSIEALCSVSSDDLDKLMSDGDKLLSVNEQIEKLKEEVPMSSAQLAGRPTITSEPETIEIDGTFEQERYLVKINGFPVRLTGKSFKYLTKLAWSRMKRDPGWVYKEDIEVGFNQARYLYRMKNEIKEGVQSGWPIIENNRLGYYRLDIDPEKIRINTDNLRDHPDYEIRSLIS